MGQFLTEAVDRPAPERHDRDRDLLAAPLADARELLLGRMPVPKLLQTDQGGSQACRSFGRSLTELDSETSPTAPVLNSP